MNTEYKIDLVGDDGAEWARVEIGDSLAHIGICENGKMEGELFIDRDQARKLVKILDAFAHEWL